MKKQTFFKKGLALILAVTLLVAAIPAVGLLASAEDPACPAIGDDTNLISSVTSTNFASEFASDKTITLTAATQAGLTGITAGGEGTTTCFQTKYTVNGTGYSGEKNLQIQLGTYDKSASSQATGGTQPVYFRVRIEGGTYIGLVDGYGQSIGAVTGTVAGSGYVQNLELSQQSEVTLTFAYQVDDGVENLSVWATYGGADHFIATYDMADVPSYIYKVDVGALACTFPAEGGSIVFSDFKYWKHVDKVVYLDATLLERNSLDTIGTQIFYNNAPIYLATGEVDHVLDLTNYAFSPSEEFHITADYLYVSDTGARADDRVSIGAVLGTYEDDNGKRQHVIWKEEVYSRSNNVKIVNDDGDVIFGEAKSLRDSSDVFSIELIGKGGKITLVLNNNGVKDTDKEQLTDLDLSSLKNFKPSYGFFVRCENVRQSAGVKIGLSKLRVTGLGITHAVAKQTGSGKIFASGFDGSKMLVTVKSISSTTLKEGSVVMTDSKGDHAVTAKVSEEGSYTTFSTAYTAGETVTFSAEFENTLPQNDASLMEGNRFSDANKQVNYDGSPITRQGGRHSFEIRNYDFSKSDTVSLETKISYSAPSGDAATNEIWLAQIIGRYDIDGHGTQYVNLMYRVGSNAWYLINDDGEVINSIYAGYTAGFSATEFDFIVSYVDGKYTWSINGDEIFADKDLGLTGLKNFTPCFGAFMRTTNGEVTLSLDNLTIGGNNIIYTKQHLDTSDMENLALKSRLIRNYDPNSTNSPYTIPAENPQVLASDLGVDILEVSGTEGYTLDTFDIDLSDGKSYIYGADFKIFTNTRTESSFGFVPVFADGRSQFNGITEWRQNDPYRVCAVANGGGNPWGPIQNYGVWLAYGKYNDLSGSQGALVATASEEGCSVNLKVQVTAEMITLYMNDYLCATYPVITDQVGGEATPALIYFFRNITKAEISNFFAAGDALTPKKAVPQPPVAPEVIDVTDSSVTLKANADYQYSKDNTNWQDSNKFVGLLSEYEYTFYQRYRATADAYESMASAPCYATTLASHNMAPESRLTRSANPYRVGTEVVLDNLVGTTLEHRSSEVGRASYSYDTYTVDLSNGKTFTMGADFKVYTNSWTESSFGFMPMMADGYSELNSQVQWRANIPYRVCLVGNGQMNGDKWGATQNYRAWLCYGEYNNLYQQPVGETVTATEEGTSVALMCTVSETQIDFYVNGVLTLTVPVTQELSGKIEPHLSYFAKNCNVDISNFFLTGDALNSSKIAYEENLAPISRAVNTDGIYKKGNKIMSTDLLNDHLAVDGTGGFCFDTFDIDLSNGKYYVMGADFYIANNTRKESSFGFIPIFADANTQMNGVHGWYADRPYRIGAVANGQMIGGVWSSTPTYLVWETMGEYNDLVGGGGAPIMTTTETGYQKVNFKVKTYADKIELYVNDYLNETYPIYTDKAPNGGKVTPTMYLFFRNCNGYATNVSLWGNALTYVEPAPIPTIPAMGENMAPYIQMKLNGKSYTNYFGNKLVGTGGHYEFGGVEVTNPANPSLTFRANVNLISRSKKADGNDMEWAGPRFSYMVENGHTWYMYMMQGSVALMSEGSGHGSISSNLPIKVGSTHDVCFQYFLKQNKINVWIDGDLIFNMVELPGSDDPDRKLFFGCWFESCNATLTNMKYYGNGVTINLDEETRALYNNPMFTSTAIPAIPDGNINYFQNCQAVDSSGDISFKMADNYFTNLFTDETGTIRFLDAAGKRNINNIKNSSTFVMQFDYTVKDTDTENTKENGGVMMFRRMTPPVNSANYGLGFYMTQNNAGFRRYANGSVAETFDANFKYEVGKTYHITILSAPTWSKLWIDGEQKVVATGLPQYPFTMQYLPLYSACEISNFALYDTAANEDREIAEPSDVELAMTGKTVTALDNYEFGLGMSKYLIPAIAACVAVLICAGLLVFFILRNKKKKSQ